MGIYRGPLVVCKKNLGMGIDLGDIQGLGSSYEVAR